MKRLSYYLNKLRERFTVKSGRTVRTMFSLFGLAALLLAAAVGTSNDVSYIKLETTSTMVKTGDRFSVEVYAYAHVPVNAVDITLNFDPSKVEVLSVDKGQSVLTLWTEEPTVKDGKVTMRGGTYRKGFVGEHKIATIELAAKQTGQSEVGTGEVVLLAGDGRGTPVKTAAADGSTLSLYVYDEQTDPEKIGVDVKIEILTDIDGDGKVSLKDVSAFMGAWMNSSRVYDFNNDGKMTFRDFSIILADAFLGN